MVGRLFDRILGRFGYGLISLRQQREEREANAKSVSSLQDQLDAAVRQAERLSRERAIETQAHQEAEARLWAKIGAARATLEETRSALDAAVARAEQLAAERRADAQSNAEAQARLWGKVQSALSDLAESRAALEAAAGSRAAEAQAQEAAQARLWGRIDELRGALDASREQTRAVSERSAAEIEAQGRTLTRVWARLDHERQRLAAATAAGTDARKQARALERELATANRRLARNLEKLDAMKARRGEMLAEIAGLQARLRAGADDRTLAAAQKKLDAERSNAKALKLKLQSEQKRAARLDAELKAAKADARAMRLEADRARGEEQRLVSELAMTAQGAAMGARSGDPSDAALEWLSKSDRRRLGPEQEAAEQFRLGRSFQAQGAIGLAAACYRRVGPFLDDLLAQQGPDGDRIVGPDFLVIGAARAGTTWLKKCLAHHAQVFILAGEHHYFSTSSHLPPETYVGRFANAHTRFARPGAKTKQFARPSERLYGEKSTTYLAMPQAQIDLCASLFPRLRLVCLVRDPTARVWSHLKHLKANESLRRLDKLSDLPPWMEVDELIRQGRYEEHLIRWARRFDPEQILLVDFERIAREPDTVHAEIIAHIGAEPAPAPTELDEVNRTERFDMPPVLADRLRAAFEQERFDIPYLRAAMQRAAEARTSGKPGEPSPRRKSVRLAG